MRGSAVVSLAARGGILKIGAATILATTAIVATAGTISPQDVTALTNTRTADENRWLAYLVSVPSGSEHSQALEGRGNFSFRTANHVVGVQTEEALHILDRRHIMESGEPARINRAMMGDRVFQPGESTEMLLSRNLTQPDTMVTASFAKSDNGSKTQNATVQTFVKLESPSKKSKKTPSAKRWAVANGQMLQARAAARAMGQVAEKVRREEVQLASNEPVSANVSAYASEDTSMASAFSAVLRPALRKEEKKKVAKKPASKPVKKKAKRNFLQKAVASVASLSKRKKRNVVRLGRGDHKWAANPLPRHAYSSSERRCLAAGIYFEARSEPLNGQRAVAQVILNRVKNPTYPNTICGVVYQNKWRRNACQFSFACDGIRDRVKSKKHWRKAVKVANAAVDGRFWLKSVGSASHYHADYVWPKWRRKMRKMTKIGRHIFYRTYGGGWS